MTLGFIGLGIMGRPMAKNDHGGIIQFYERLANIEVRKCQTQT
jgi:3-hydroxyisobutyrate dehydrogenase-like beta-hydroxyacid dehydrogenase